MEGTLLAGRYRLQERQSVGRPGDVWRCVDEQLGTTVAIQLLIVPVRDAGFVERIRSQWTPAMASIRHPGLIQVRDAGIDPEAGLYLIMEYVDGQFLSRILSRTGRLEPARVLELVAQLGGALQVIHDHGLVHGELHPGVVQVRPDETFVMSPFGFTALAVGTEVLTGGIGRMLLLAPERIRGEATAAGSDIYTLGAVAYMCLAGRRPFDDGDAGDLARKILQEAPPPMPSDVPPAIGSIVERAMAKDPDDRWPSAGAFAAAARSIAAG